MKNSKEYANKIQKLYHSLARKYPKVPKVNHEEVERAIVYAIIGENFSDSATESVMKRMTDYFVDLNDLRVSRTDEIVEMLGENTSVARDMAAKINKALNGIFNLYHKVSLEALKKMGKRPAKQILEKIDGIDRFVVDYCMITSLGGHAIPLTKKMLEYLRNNELVQPGADEQEIGGFLAKQIPARSGYEFYSLLRRESETEEAVGKKKVRATRKKIVETDDTSDKKTRKKNDLA